MADKKAKNIDESKEPVLCPIAAVKTCRKCPFFEICPIKETVGNYRPSPEEKQKRTKDVPDFANVLKETLDDVADTAQENLKKAADATEQALQKFKNRKN